MMSGESTGVDFFLELSSLQYKAIHFLSRVQNTLYASIQSSINVTLFLIKGAICNCYSYCISNIFHTNYMKLHVGFTIYIDTCICAVTCTLHTAHVAFAPFLALIPNASSKLAHCHKDAPKKKCSQGGEKIQPHSRKHHFHGESRKLVLRIISGGAASKNECVCGFGRAM